MMLDHPSIVKLHEVLENEEYVFFVMELCGGGSLSNYVEMKPLSERLARYYMPQLIKGLKYCHNKVRSINEGKPAPPATNSQTPSIYAGSMP